MRNGIPVPIAGTGFAMEYFNFFCHCPGGLVYMAFAILLLHYFTQIYEPKSSLAKVYELRKCQESYTT